MKRNFLLIILIFVVSFANSQVAFESLDAGLPDLTFSISKFGDFDGDGDLDLYLSGYDGTNVVGGLYKNDNSVFTLVDEVTSGLPAIYMGSADCADIDNDGDLDIVLLGSNASYTDIVEVYKNNNDGTFTSLNVGMLGAEQGEVTFADFNGDGNIDISYSAIGADDRITKFYQNNNDGTFTEKVTTVPGLNLGRIKWADYDNDNDLDFVITGFDDGTGGSNTFYSKIFRNDAGTFVESGILIHQGWLGDIQWADYNNDGNVDLIISGTGGDGTERYTVLYKNNGDGTFTELTTTFDGVSHSTIKWADFDLDGDLDVFIVGETTTPGDGNSISKIFLNKGNDIFFDSGIDIFNFSYFGYADSGDFNNDGKTDLVITGYSSAGYATSGSEIYKNNSIATVISEISKKDIAITPNPANDYITIQSINNINKVEIIDISGKIILQKNISNRKANIKIQNFNSGMYFVKIYNENKNTVKRIIIQ